MTSSAPDSTRFSESCDLDRCKARHQVVPLFASDILQILKHLCPGSDADSQHKEYTTNHEIVFTRQGAYVRRDPDGTIVADANHMLFFHKEQPYQVSHPLPGQDVSIIFVVNPSVLLDILTSFNPWTAEFPEKPFPSQQLPLTSHAHLLIYQILSVANESKVDPLAIEELTLSLLVEVFAQHESNRSGGSRSSPRTQRVHSELANQLQLLLNEKSSERLSISHLAAQLHTSPYHLSRVFKGQTDQTIHQYLIRLRLHAALERLAEQPSLPLTELALELGFNDHSHFTNTFRARYGLTPTQFRRKATVRHLRRMSKILQV